MRWWARTRSIAWLLIGALLTASAALLGPAAEFWFPSITSGGIRSAPLITIATLAVPVLWVWGRTKSWSLGEDVGGRAAWVRALDIASLLLSSSLCLLLVALAGDAFLMLAAATSLAAYGAIGLLAGAFGRFRAANYGALVYVLLAALVGFEGFQVEPQFWAWPLSSRPGLGGLAWSVALWIICALLFVWRPRISRGSWVVRGIGGAPDLTVSSDL